MFWALIGAIYLTLGLPEVYRVLFEVFGFDVDAKGCQPKARNLEDEDYLSPELDGKTLSWQDIAYYQVCRVHCEVCISIFVDSPKEFRHGMLVDCKRSTEDADFVGKANLTRL